MQIEGVLAGTRLPRGEWDFQRIQQDLAESDQVATAWRDGALVGFASGTAAGGGISLSWLVVRAGHRRKGIGRRLVSLLLDRFPGCDVVNVIANRAAVPFYRACGFEIAPHVVPMTKALRDPGRR